MVLQQVLVARRRASEGGHFGKDGLQLGMDARVAGGDFRIARLIRPAAEVGHHPSGLADDERAGGGIPRLQVQFPEAIKPSASNVAKIERG